MSGYLRGGMLEHGRQGGITKVMLPGQLVKYLDACQPGTGCALFAILFPVPGEHDLWRTFQQGAKRCQLQPMTLRPGRQAELSPHAVIEKR